MRFPQEIKSISFHLFTFRQIGRQVTTVKIRAKCGSSYTSSLYYYLILMMNLLCVVCRLSLCTLHTCCFKKKRGQHQGESRDLIHDSKLGSRSVCYLLTNNQVERAGSIV